ncbi:MAG: type 2 lantipeptide synthetase LanM family protein [Blastocatellia bacterium]|nr:type 2 lantipeptide synthetase LanM family protein [Blastocatellia bacterium]
MFESTNWYKALTLKERSNSIQHIDNKSLSENEKTVADRRFQQWKSKPAFKNELFFQQRLSSDNLNEETFFFLLGEGLESLVERVPTRPKWLVELQEVSYTLETEAENSDPTSFDKFLAALSPLISTRQQKVNREIYRLKAKYPKTPIDQDLLQTFLFKIISHKLKSQVILRTLVSKMKSSREKGLLKGDTPQERFKFFIKEICTPQNTAKLLQEFPVLARQILIYLDNWVEFSFSFASHLFGDWNDVVETFFSQQDVGSIIDLKRLGDEHRKGAVIKIELSNGSKIIYKPKPLGIDVKFQKLLHWFNSQGHQPDFKLSKILDKGDHGWVEFLSPAACSTLEEVKRFYKRQGNNLALLHALAASDMHSENIIANGEYPVVVDLEMLFCQTIPLSQDITDTGVLDKLSTYKTLTSSALSVGLIPGLDYGNDKDYKGIDFSALGGEPGQLFPGVPTWINKETDEMQLVHKPKEIKTGFNNLPYLGGIMMRANNFLDEILEGFKFTYSFILKNKDLLISDNGIINNFRGERIRIIERPTGIYAVLLEESYNPNLLRNAIARDWFFDYLWMDRRLYERELTKWLIDSELADLQDGLIPYFTTYTDSKDLWNSKGEKIENVFLSTSFDIVIEHINSFSIQAMEQQCWFIKTSFAAKETNQKQKIKYLKLQNDILLQPDYEQKLLENAKIIGDKLLSTAIYNNDYASWITLDIESNGKFEFTSTSVDLYHGICGVTIFLAYLGYLTENSTYTTLARKAIKMLDHDFCYKKLDKIGAFDGLGSIVYALSHLSTLWKDQNLIKKAEEMANKILALVKQDKSYDVISGSAGSILSLLSLYKVSPSKAILNIAVECGNHLVLNAQKQDKGVGWVTIENSPPLSGFSHGAAGIAYALLYLGNLTNDYTFIETANEAIEYERSLFVEQVGNWLDLRENKRDIYTAWCHGAPGIGLGRLQCLDFISDETIKKEVQIATETTLKESISINTSLCCGGLGNIDFLMQASEKIHQPKSDLIKQIANAILKKIEVDGIECLTVSHMKIEIPGLMKGMVGAGYQLLRLAKPDLVPSVLCLAPPVL